MKKKILVIVLLIVFIFGLSGCTFTKKDQNNNSNTIKKQEKKIKEDIVVGKYSLIEMKGESQSYTKEELKLLKDNGFEVVLDVKEDKTAELILFENEQSLSYDSKYFYSSDEKIEYSYEGGILTLINDDQYLVFELQK